MQCQATIKNKLNLNLCEKNLGKFALQDHEFQEKHVLKKGINSMFFFKPFLIIFKQHKLLAKMMTSCLLALLQTFIALLISLYILS